MGHPMSSEFSSTLVKCSLAAPFIALLWLVLAACCRTFCCGGRRRSKRDIQERESCKAQLIACYTVHNPPKLKDVEKLLEQFGGKYAMLLKAVEKKYPEYAQRKTGGKQKAE
jgi:hypothetical protein